VYLAKKYKLFIVVAVWQRSFAQIISPKTNATVQYQKGRYGNYLSNHPKDYAVLTTSQKQSFLPYLTKQLSDLFKLKSNPAKDKASSIWQCNLFCKMCLL
jgi:hypothetical protein